MKKLTRVIIAVVAVLAMAMPASAQFRFGLKAGMNVNSLHFDESAVSDLKSPDNRTGFTGGITCEFTVPVVGLGFDASVMYVRRTGEIDDKTTVTEYNNDYLEVPINLKWKIGIPVVGRIITPYAFTGPSFAFLCSKKDVEAVWKNKTFDATWNVGGGVQLMGHLQIGAAYGWGMTKALERVGINSNAADVGRLKGWTVTAAYFF